jgi:hypothetical protein
VIPVKEVVEGNVEDINKPEGSVRVIWEILPGEGEYIFREIEQEDIDPSFFSLGLQNNTDDFPTIPHPVLNPADDCLDRVWTQSIIKINYQSSDRFDKYEP